MPLNLGSVLRRTDDVRYRIFDGEAVVIRQRSAEVMGLNPVAARLFDLLDARTPVGELLDRVEDEFEVERSTLEADSLRFLSELLETGVAVEV
jgi:Coenzyme PQQ synthesis protein D (PqqD)